MAIYAQTRQTVLKNVCEGNIAVVGNGPISESQRKIINNYDCIIRFNDEKNKLNGERTDLLVLRNNTLFLGTADVNVLPVIPFCKKHLLNRLHYKKILPPVYVYENTCEDAPGAIEMSKKKIYPNCFKEARHGDSPIGPSTGTALLSTLQDDDTVKSINVFGMNFNGDFIGAFHVDFIDMNLTNICCTKCIFHETFNDEYKY
jgi:hypothetical protein